MTPQELKNSILQLAIQGKLVEQRPEEGTAEELFAKIQEEKQRLIAGKKIKKEKPLPEITDDEKPFDIPESWKWVRLRNIVYNRGQLTPQRTFSYIDIGSIDNQRQLLNTDENIIEADKAPSRARKIVEQGDILYSTVRPYLHNMCIVDKQFSYQPIASTGFAVLTCHQNICNKYLFYYLMTPTFDSYANSNENAKGVAYPAINDDRLYRAVVAVPPLAEQKRIVAKIEELLPYIDRYEQAWSKLEQFNSRFPEDMKKSLLQYAIQGKLVEQRPEEGTAEELFAQIQKEKQKLIAEKKIKKEKPLPEITDDEKPFNIPESWKWVKIKECFSNKTGLSYKKDSLEIKSNKMIRVLRGGNILDTKFILKPDDIWISDTFVKKDLLLRKNTIITPAVTSLEHIGKMGRIDADYNNMVVGGFVLMLLPHYLNDTLSKYLLYAMSSRYFRDECRNIVNKSGQAFYNISREKLMNLYVPLPPLAEQKRIVEKLEQLLPLCEQLK